MTSLVSGLSTSVVFWRADMVYFCHQRTLWTAAVLCCSHEKLLSFPNSHVPAALAGHGCASVISDVAVQGSLISVIGFVTCDTS